MSVQEAEPTNNLARQGLSNSLQDDQEGHDLWRGARRDGRAVGLHSMITQLLTLDDINKGFDLMHVGKSIRVVVVYWS